MAVKFGASSDPFASRRQLVVFTAAAICAAIGIGLVGGAFRWALEWAQRRLGTGLALARDMGPLGLGALCAAVALLAMAGRALAMATPRASGSGIQDVKAVWLEEEELPGRAVLPARFVGGIAAIGSGLVLGREGPSVHIGATIGAEVGRWFRLGEYERKLLYTTVGGAGLAVAFNAPIGGALFTIEEITRSFRARVVLITLVSTCIAVATSHYLIADEAVFQVARQVTPDPVQLWVFILFGGLTALLGMGYNWLNMALLRFADRTRIPSLAWAAIVGAIVGALLYTDPLYGGGGEAAAQWVIDVPAPALGGLLLLMAVRFVAGPLSYSTRAPGGLFAPTLAVGAVWGVVFHAVAAPLVGGISPATFAVVGMAALFTATVGSPLTGIVLILEMTAATSLTTPMFLAAAAAMFAATLLPGRPIYESLRRRMLQQNALWVEASRGRRRTRRTT
ncbi:chloride channel protein [Tessaracoccus lacteus]|uniref:Chloride channel protein n=1 Tax=Tessaracoccus lacteus TaxID=3041766 RepID=A0ABY8PUJ9_9ACTN|nr:chloride channel protein [Tessaracoccus sp. T21]WGT46116.1 chloride channel protein [Tessaracoccus sp. T21]